MENNTRESVYMPGFQHKNPIPIASKIGPFLYSGALTGKDPHRNLMPAGLEEQCKNVFAHVRTLMTAAGGSVDDIIKMTFRVADYRDRDAINIEWLAMFPSEESRPARQVVAGQLDGGALIHCDLVGILASSE